MMKWQFSTVSLIICIICISAFSPNRPLNPQATWELVKKRVSTATILDVVSVIGRFQRREEFYEGDGTIYTRPPDDKLLNNKLFLERIQQLEFKRWPVDEEGDLVGAGNLTEQEIEEKLKDMQNIVSKAGAEAIFTALAKGATNGLTYPIQVDEELSKWLDLEKGILSIKELEKSLLFGRISVAIGWFLYVGLQFGGIYVVFFAPIMTYFFPDVDFYPVQTFLHTSEWGK